jgi:hypothetical protein
VDRVIGLESVRWGISKRRRSRLEKGKRREGRRWKKKKEKREIERRSLSAINEEKEMSRDLFTVSLPNVMWSFRSGDLVFLGVFSLSSSTKKVFSRSLHQQSNYLCWYKCYNQLPKNCRDCNFKNSIAQNYFVSEDTESFYGKSFLDNSDRFSYFFCVLNSFI